MLVDAIPRDRVRQLHARVALALERRHPDRTGEIALHYDAAGEPSDAYRAAQAAAQSGGPRVRARRGRTVSADRGAERDDARRSSRRFASRSRTSRKPAGGSTRSRSCAISRSSGSTARRDERRALTLRRMRERARIELGQPARKTLDALVALDAEASRLGFDRERVAILLATSQTLRATRRSAHGGAHRERRRGDGGEDRRSGVARRRAQSAWATRWSASRQDARTRSTRARSTLFESIGDVRGQARSYGNLGIAAQFESRLDEAFDAYRPGDRRRALGRNARSLGLAALNLGVLSQKCGEYDRARELFAEALALFAAVKHSEYQLAALFNMAHVERELGLWESASELYEATIPLAQRIGQSDIEIGAMAGAGLCALELGRLGSCARRRFATSTRGSATGRNGTRAARSPRRWSSGCWWLDGRPTEAFAPVCVGDFARRIVRCLQCGLADRDLCRCFGTVQSDGVRSSILSYRDRVRQLGYAEMTRRYEALAQR